MPRKIDMKYKDKNKYKKAKINKLTNTKAYTKII